MINLLQFWHYLHSFIKDALIVSSATLREETFYEEKSPEQKNANYISKW